MKKRKRSDKDEDDDDADDQAGGASQEPTAPKAKKTRATDTASSRGRKTTSKPQSKGVPLRDVLHAESFARRPTFRLTAQLDACTAVNWYMLLASNAVSYSAKRKCTSNWYILANTKFASPATKVKNCLMLLLAFVARCHSMKIWTSDAGGATTSSTTIISVVSCTLQISTSRCV